MKNADGWESLELRHLRDKAQAAGPDQAGVELRDLLVVYVYTRHPDDRIHGRALVRRSTH
jgi:hypothetical protein